MKKSNTCETCGVSYKFPASITPTDIRQKICFTCELNVMAVSSMLSAVCTRRSSRSANTDSKYLNNLLKFLLLRDDDRSSSHIWQDMKCVKCGRYMIDLTGGEPDGGGWSTLY